LNSTCPRTKLEYSAKVSASSKFAPLGILSTSSTLFEKCRRQLVQEIHATYSTGLTRTSKTAIIEAAATLTPNQPASEPTSMPPVGDRPSSIRDPLAPCPASHFRRLAVQFP
jgi:hypothetical protein